MNIATVSGVLALVWATGACAEGADTPWDDTQDADEVSDDAVDVEHAVGSTVCFDGKSGAGNVCWNLLGDPMNDGVNNDAYYTIKSQCVGTWGITPIAYFRQWKMDRSTYVAPNFTLAELGRVYTGQQYMLAQPHAVRKLQAMRNQIGALKITSGYRPPGYNYGLEGAADCSRHMYGDAYDIVPLNASLNQVGAACEGQNGKPLYYDDGHVHCDFRNDEPDPRMLAKVSQAVAGPLSFGPEYGATVEFDGKVLRAPAKGFDEGEPRRRWIALDGDGETIDEYEGAAYAPPAGAVSVAVDVGGAVEATFDL